MTKYVGAIDQGTTSSRFMVFDEGGAVISFAQKEHRQILPRPGWVEHDPEEILGHVFEAAGAALGRINLSAKDLAAVGITSQRETTLVWDRRTGRPLCNAVVWMDMRTASLVHQFAKDGGQDRFRAKTGLPLATYFSALKLRWIFANVAGAFEKAQAGEALFGTMDSWLAWHLTGRHVTDVTNASRTMLMDLLSCDWDDELLGAFGIPRACLPEICSSSQDFGAILASPLAGTRLAGILGDQQAALVGQTCFAPGEAKNTYGTGSFMLMNTGTVPVQSSAGLLTTLAYQFGEAKPHYALEGAIAITGALVQWLRDNFGLFEHAAEIEALAAGVPDNGDVYIVPAFSGLFAPYWRDDARGVITGLTRFATRAHLARAALEACAFQVRDVAEAMQADSGILLASLKTDGGMVGNDLLMQFQADILGVEVVRPRLRETTALGAAYAAGLAVGYWPDLLALRENWGVERVFTPAMEVVRREGFYRNWKKAVERSFGWVEG